MGLWRSIWSSKAKSWLLTLGLRTSLEIIEMIAAKIVPRLSRSSGTAESSKSQTETPPPNVVKTPGSDGSRSTVNSPSGEF